MRFSGSKIALINKDRIIALLRDNYPGLHGANKWDLPGGAREGAETPVQCALREVKEELGLDLDKEAIVWSKEYDSIYTPGTKVWFFAAEISQDHINAIKFGDEGQKYELVPAQEFINNPEALEYCRTRLHDFLKSRQ